MCFIFIVNKEPPLLSVTIFVTNDSYLIHFLRFFWYVVFYSSDFRTKRPYCRLHCPHPFTFHLPFCKVRPSSSPLFPCFPWIFFVFFFPFRSFTQQKLSVLSSVPVLRPYRLPQFFISDLPRVIDSLVFQDPV